MTDVNNPKPQLDGADPAQDAAAEARRAAAAKQRFFALSLFRLSGALIMIFGMAISLERFDWVQGDNAKWMGLIFSVVGLFQFLVVPRMLARLFSTARMAEREQARKREQEGA